MSVAKIALLASLFVSTGAVAQIAAPAPSAPAPVKEKKICRGEVALGSIMSKRVCHTKSEWAAIRAKDAQQAADALDQMHRRGGQGLTSSN